MDFETFNPAIPLFDHNRPYQQIPFQYSLHYQKSVKSDVTHHEFLGDGRNDPRIKFIESLLQNTKEKGDILVYNQTFETRILKELARDFPEFKREIEERLSRIIDLMIPFQKKLYYHPKMNGQYSIKAVLPALIPKLRYSDLNIQEGGMASNTYSQLSVETDKTLIQQIRKDLFEYCKMDTFAMVMILKKLNEI